MEIRFNQEVYCDENFFKIIDLLEGEKVRFERRPIMKFVAGRMQKTGSVKSRTEILTC